MKRLTTYILAFAIAVFGTLAVVQPALAVDPNAEATKGLQAAGDSGSGSLSGSLRTISDILLFVLGAIAVIVIIIGGIRYATSGGDSGQVKSAKDTILYAVIGLVVAILAYAIVRFIIDNMK